MFSLRFLLFAFDCMWLRSRPPLCSVPRGHREQPCPCAIVRTEWVDTPKPWAQSPAQTKRPIDVGGDLWCRRPRSRPLLWSPPHTPTWRPTCSFHTSPKLSLKASSRFPPPLGSSSNTPEGSTQYDANPSLIPGSWPRAQGRRAGGQKGRTSLRLVGFWYSFAICFHITFLPCGIVSSQPSPLPSCVTGSKQQTSLNLSVEHLQLCSGNEHTYAQGCVLVPSGCYHKIPQTGWLISSRTLSLATWRLGAPGSRCW